MKSQTSREPAPRKDRAVYVISIAAELAGVHPQTLRIYERKELLTPKRTTGNSRRYSERDVETLRKIQQLTQDEGVNLAGVKIIMDLERRLAETEAQLERARHRAIRAEHQLRDVTRRRGELVRLSDIKRIFEG